MAAVLKTLKPALSLIFLGFLLRLALIFLCGFKLGSLPDFCVALLTGAVYDFAFACTLLLVCFLLGVFTSHALLNGVILAVALGWVALNAIDVLSLYYTGTRAGLNTFNLFSLGDLAAKAEVSQTTAGFAGYWLLFSLFTLRVRRHFRINTSIFNLKQKVAWSVFFLAGSLLYLPFPLNYYSDQLPVSKSSRQLAVNPFYSWSASLQEIPEDYPLDISQAFEVYQKQFSPHVSTKEWGSREVNYTDSGAYERIILVIMESFGANRIGALGGRKKLSPAFDSLCREGTLYTACFACGPRTQYAISSILYGFPHILGYNLFRHNKQKLPFEGLISLLSKNNYRSHFIHGGYAAYDDMNLLLGANDTLQVKDAANIERWGFRNKWGVDDNAFFHYAARYILAQPGRNFFTLLSMSNHEPFQLPEGFSNEPWQKNLLPSEKTFYYSDKALGDFIGELKRKNMYDKSLIIVTGDHGESYSGAEDVETKLFHVPLLVIDHKTNGKVTRPCSHADLAEFILSRSGYKGKSHLAGRGLVDMAPRAVFYRNYDNDLYSVTGAGIFRYNLLNKTLSKISTDTTMYVKQTIGIPVQSPEYRMRVDEMLSYLCVGRYVFENGLYKQR